MEIFKKNDKLSFVIHRNYHLLPVLNRFGIKLGIKDKTVDDICREMKISTGFFLAIINTYNNEEYFPREELLTFSPLEITHYLKKTHQYYFLVVIPRLDDLLEKLIASNTSDFKGLKMVDVFYKKYKEELTQHINYEEERVFPYVINLIKNKKIDPRYTIRSFETEHSNVDEKLNDLKNLIIKYLTPDYDENICNDFLITLSLFEKDLEDHARIEDKILMPITIEIENKEGR
ncbi:regulator of cell morphogenesis and NO signaling [Mariniphaga anaerophila]|uniref:Regulator of cell morphogenesis and NO signaling n=1 Tax=Mariniphaga anaerophila TaxID=1484053 RepID=A0A1M5AJB2_9BACT|nr:hemerythrin domain-containing protein [Mariniphaga anaerophila]SHF30293.1 regulator of cell morphogenesis and NO signaling [Mariniphaga anaerophila]